MEFIFFVCILVYEINNIFYVGSSDVTFSTNNTFSVMTVLGNLCISLKFIKICIVSELGSSKIQKL